MWNDRGFSLSFTAGSYRANVALFMMLALLLMLTALGRLSARMGTHGTEGAARTASTAAEAKVRDAYARLPVYFIPNKGQLPKDVAFYVTGAGYRFYATPSGITYAFTRAKARAADRDPADTRKDHSRSPGQGYALRTRFAGANPAPTIIGELSQKAKINYLKGSDPAGWRTDLPTYRQVTYKNLYPGVDLSYSGNHKRVKYQYTVSPGASYQKIALAYEGAKSLKLDKGGNLLVGTPWGNLVDEKPVAYQIIGGKKVGVPAAFAVAGTSVGFRLGRYDPRLSVVIDPGLTYSTFLGGSGNDYAYGIAVDSAGNAYVSGYTQDDVTDYPTSGGAYDTSHNGSYDAFVTKLNSTGSSLSYSTFLGGSGDDYAFRIVVDSGGNAYVTGYTQDAATDYPTTTGAYDETQNGSYDAFVTKLNSTGASLSYSTLLGGDAADYGQALAVDSGGNACVTGQTADGTADYPTTGGAYDVTHNGGSWDVFVTKLNSAGSSLSYSTFVGGSSSDQGFDVAIDSGGNAYVTGAVTSADYPTTGGAYDGSQNGSTDGFITKLNSAGSSLSYSTFLGGTGSEYGRGIAVGSGGDAYVTGRSTSSDYPTTAGAYDETQNGSYDAFVTKLNSAGSSLSYSTFLGGSDSDQGYGISVDSGGNTYVTGLTSDAATDYPTTSGAYDETHNGIQDAFFTKLNSAGSSLSYSTFLGGSGYEYGTAIALDSSDNPYVAGRTQDDVTDYPTTSGAYDETQDGNWDAFVTKLDLSSPPPAPIPDASEWALIILALVGAAVLVWGGLKGDRWTSRRTAA